RHTAPHPGECRVSLPTGSSWGVPAALVVLSLVPVTAGSLRLLEIAGGPHILPTNPRIDAVPAPVVVHIVAATVYALLGGFQFPARLRRRWPDWHRRPVACWSGPECWSPSPGSG
ncbi:MAG: hypothetical protein JWR85_2211, partial [Marmoricola sp.]|nr:hypothetical protein [Marmoricola sp.]